MKSGRNCMIFILSLVLWVGLPPLVFALEDGSPFQNHSTDIGRYKLGIDPNQKMVRGHGELSVNSGSDGGSPDGWSTPQPYETQVPACPKGFKGEMRYAVRDTAFTAYQETGIYFNSWRLAADRYQPLCVKNGYYVLNLCGFAYFNIGGSAFARPVNVDYEIFCVPATPGSPNVPAEIIDETCKPPKDNDACSVQEVG